MADYLNADMTLFLERRVDWDRLASLRGGPDAGGADIDVCRMLLQTCDQICGEIEEAAVAGWHESARLEDGRVVRPAHVDDGYRRLREAGLLSPTVAPEYGGAGVPLLVSTMQLEMIGRVDPSLMTIVGLQQGVAADIERYGSAELKETYLPRFVAGELEGAMDLTEPGAGSDLGGIRTRASEEGGRFFVDGQKIFITNGGAQVHLVLARDAATFEESAGTTKGLTLLLCPRMRPDGSPNGVTIPKVEEKIGLHGSPTCVVDFEHAEAFVLGTRGDGFRAMLDLMNNARLGVAAQAVGIAEASYRAARAYAAERMQFRSDDAGGAPAHAARQVLRDRDQRRRDAHVHPDPWRHGLHGRDARRTPALRFDHHDDLRGHLRDPGEFRAARDRQRRVGYRLRRPARGARRHAGRRPRAARPARGRGHRQG